MKKELKEHLDKLKKEGKNHESCDFNLKEFNLTKRELSDKDKKGANKSSFQLKNENIISEAEDDTGGGEDDMIVDSSLDPLAPGGNKVNKRWACILLDFNGHLVENTAWNYAGPINCLPANLTTAQVDEVLLNVRNEYFSYKVNVTTDENVYNQAPIAKRMRLILTETWEWYGQVGGVAFIGSFTWGDNTPCFVFTSLLNYSTKFIKEASSHEIGHTMGLYHQCTYDENCVKTAEYNGGNGIECPIMGLPYYTPDAGTMWWIGPNPFGCNNIQDDNAILKQLLGLK